MSAVIAATPIYVMRLRRLRRCASAGDNSLRSAGDDGYSEIGDDRVASGIDEDVVRLYISVHDPPRMGELQRLGDLVRQSRGFPDRQGALLGNAVTQRAAGEQAHDQIQQSTAGLCGVQRHNVRMFYARDRARLSQELRLVIRRYAERGIEHLDGNIALQARIVGAEYRAGCAGAERFAQLQLIAEYRGEASAERFGIRHGHTIRSAFESGQVRITCSPESDGPQHRSALRSAEL